MSSGIASPADVLEVALTRPADLAPDALEVVLAALDPRDGSGWAPALAALVYAREDLATRALVESLAVLLASPSLSEPGAPAAILEALVPTRLASDVLEAVRRLLSDPRPDTPTRDRLVAVLGSLVSWRPELSSVEAIVELASRPSLDAYRNTLLGDVVEPLLVREPGAVTDAVLDRLVAVFGGCPRLAYTLAMLGERPAAASAVRDRVAALAAEFPLRAAARAALAGEPFDLLVVVNVRIGQGDELIRLVLLLQALLDARPTLRVTLITRRTYLYDHPRVRPVSILDEAAVDCALGGSYDGVVHLSERGWPDLAWRGDLDARVDDLIAARRPALAITIDTGVNRFVYRTVVLDGREVAPTRGLDRPTVDSVYDPLRRLLIELGLRAPAAEETLIGARLLAATPSADAERVWRDLTGDLPLPVALVNPFGGAHRSKGYPPARPHRLALELADLVDEGYSVVLIPNGTAWGGRAAALDVLAHLAPAASSRVRVGPDPAEDDPAARLTLSERGELSYPDAVMRLFRYFAARADLVVTVEGWLGHLAYLLGRPLRLVLQSRMYGSDWHPRWRGPRQRLSTTLSSRGRRAAPDVLGPEDVPPLPSWDGKPLFQAALAGLARLDPARAMPLLLRALASEDHDVRASAVAAVGRLDDGRATPLALAALRDPVPRVRGAAAASLLAAGTDFTRALGPHFGAVLAAHRDIARQDWTAVQKLGLLAVPALFVAAGGQPDPMRREARWVLARLFARHGIRVGSSGDTSLRA